MEHFGQLPLATTVAVSIWDKWYLHCLHLLRAEASESPLTLVFHTHIWSGSSTFKTDPILITASQPHCFYPGLIHHPLSLMLLWRLLAQLSVSVLTSPSDVCSQYTSQYDPNKRGWRFNHKPHWPRSFQRLLSHQWQAEVLEVFSDSVSLALAGLALPLFLAVLPALRDALHMLPKHTPTSGPLYLLPLPGRLSKNHFFSPSLLTSLFLKISFPVRSSRCPWLLSQTLPCYSSSLHSPYLVPLFGLL